MKLKVPPPLVLLLAAFAAYFISRFFPVLYLPLPFVYTVLSFFVVTGFLIIVRAAISFRHFKTTIHPHKPSTTSAIVTNGLFAVSRNPMYLGMLLMLIGFCYFLSALSSFIMVPLFVFYITAFQIKPEEVMLEAKFGDVYSHYKQSVRRWL